MNCIPLILVLLATDPLGPGDQLRRLEVDGQSRSYWVHVPPQYRGELPLPVVLAFHGAGMNGKMMEQVSGLSEQADQAGFIAVYPNGTGIANLFLTFNVGQGGADEVKFVKHLLDDLDKLVNVDSRRVYATGYSNGGMLCYLLASQLADRIAAIAPVAAILTKDPTPPSRPVPVMHFHGTDDRWVPWKPRRSGPLKFLALHSVDETVQTWVRLDGCPPDPRISEMPDRQDDGTTVQCQIYGPGKEGTEVVLYVIRGGGHTWPGREPPLEFLGKSTRDISANELIWQFFSKYHLP